MGIETFRADIHYHACIDRGACIFAPEHPIIRVIGIFWEIPCIIEESPPAFNILGSDRVGRKEIVSTSSRELVGCREP